MKVCDEGFIIIFTFFFIFFFLLSFSRKRERFRSLISARRLFIIAAVGSSVIGAIVALVSAAKGASAGEVFELFGISIAIGLGVALFTSYFFYFLPRIYQNIQFKYLRSTFIYGMVLAFVFTGVAFMECQKNLPIFVASYVLGIFLDFLPAECSSDIQGTG